MTKLYLLIPGLLLFNSFKIHAQDTIYYNFECEITMMELANHYRTGKVDTSLKIFVGTINEYYISDSKFRELNYNDKGERDGTYKEFNVISEQLKISGRYERGKRVGKWIINTDTIDYSSNYTEYPIDRTEKCLGKKDSLIQSKWIRKNDYPFLKTILKPLPMKKSSDPNFIVIEDPDEFPGGLRKLGELIGKFIQYPDSAQDNNIEGVVYVQFTVNEDGTTSEFKIVKGLGYGLDEEALRVMKLMPDWKPGYQRGKPVKTKKIIPITFK